MAIKILSDTSLEPISMIGMYAGLCWGTDTSDPSKNFKRGLECIENNHGRTLEFPQIYIEISGYSARVMRELYTHIGGSPTRLQESTRYVDCSKSGYVELPNKYSDEIQNRYNEIMYHIFSSYEELLDKGVSKEDAANVLPLGMNSKMVLRTNLRQLIDMMHSRLCSRAYWEFRELMEELKSELSNYMLDKEWKYICEHYFVPKCESLGYCTEKYSCGRKPKKKLTV